ncbi:MAG: TfoX/Sxy family protein [Myxococcota bacterium]
MAHDPVLAERLRALLRAEAGLTEQRMFGGLAFLLHGHMAVVASGQGGLMLRLPADEADALVASEGVALMEMRGRPMRGWLRVDTERVAAADALAGWVARSVAFVRTLPPK